MTFKCNCGNKVEYPSKGAYNVGHAMKETNWLWVPTPDGKDVWLCESCKVQAKKIAKELFQVMGTKHFYFPSLLKDEKLATD